MGRGRRGERGLRLLCVRKTAPLKGWRESKCLRERVRARVSVRERAARCLSERIVFSLPLVFLLPVTPDPRSRASRSFAARSAVCRVPAVANHSLSNQTIPFPFLLLLLLPPPPLPPTPTPSSSFLIFPFLFFLPLLSPPFLPPPIPLPSSLTPPSSSSSSSSSLKAISPLSVFSDASA